MSPMKSRERKSWNFRYVGAVVQKDKSGQNVTAFQHMQTALRLIRSEIGSHWSCCRRDVQF